MIGPASRWVERNKLAAERRPRVRVDRCVVTKSVEGSFEVTIDGFALMPAIVPPMVTVGGVPLERMEFELGGRRITGVLPEEPESRRVVVDLGYADQAVLTDEDRTEGPSSR